MAGRLGIFGGTFDPVHYGHLLLAETCREQVRLDRVLFVPASTPPHKQQHALTPPHTRVEMLRLAIGGHERFEVSTMELERGGSSGCRGARLASPHPFHLGRTTGPNPASSSDDARHRTEQHRYPGTGCDREKHPLSDASCGGKVHRNPAALSIAQLGLGGKMPLERLSPKAIATPFLWLSPALACR